MGQEIAVFVNRSCDEPQAIYRMVRALAECLQLTIRELRLGEVDCGLAGAVFVDPDPVHLDAWPNSIPTIQVRTREVIQPAAMVSFSNLPHGPQFLRGRTFSTEAVVSNAGVTANAGEPLALTEAGSLWCSTIKAGARHDVCWVRRPWVGQQNCLFDHLNGRRFMSLLPVLDWMRHVAGWFQWQHPPLRACFIFDDPNLHSSSFGFLSFRKLVEEGVKHRYHTTMATVPLDAYFERANTVKLFRERPDVISLCVHGNNHTYRELAQPESQEVKVALMGQTLRRIEAMEQRTGLTVSRVMVPPHEACSGDTMSALVTAGFEAASLSYGSMRAFNRGEDWVTRLGASPDINNNGLQLMPRFPFIGSPENSILLAAYLGQPILPLGHHWDVADGLECLAQQAAFIHGLGEVQWMNLGRIARSSYQYRVDGEIMWIRTGARRIELPVPSGIEQIRVLAPWTDNDSEWAFVASVDRSIQSVPLQRSGDAWTRLRPPVGRLELAVVRKRPLPISTYEPNRVPMRALGRRVIVELRDRAMPFLPRRFVRR